MDLNYILHIVVGLVLVYILLGAVILPAFRRIRAREAAVKEAAGNCTEWGCGLIIDERLRPYDLRAVPEGFDVERGGQVLDRCATVEDALTRVAQRQLSISSGGDLDWLAEQLEAKGELLWALETPGDEEDKQLSDSV